MPLDLVDNPKKFRDVSVSHTKSKHKKDRFKKKKEESAKCIENLKAEVEMVTTREITYAFCFKIIPL